MKVLWVLVLAQLLAVGLSSFPVHEAGAGVPVSEHEAEAWAVRGFCEVVGFYAHYARAQKEGDADQALSEHGLREAIQTLRMELGDEFSASTERMLAAAIKAAYEAAWKVDLGPADVAELVYGDCLDARIQSIQDAVCLQEVEAMRTLLQWARPEEARSRPNGWAMTKSLLLREAANNCLRGLGALQ